MLIRSFRHLGINVHFHDFEETKHPRAKAGKTAGQFVKKGEESKSNETVHGPGSTGQSAEEQSRPDQGRSTGGSGGNGVRSDGLDIKSTYRPEGDTDEHHVFHEVEVSHHAARKYCNYITKAKNSSKYGAAVHVYEPEDYAKMRLFLNPDASAGFALKGDDIISVFKDKTGPLGACRAILDIATAQGGRRLDCFDTVLPAMYNQSGFQAVARMPFDDEYKPEGWDYDTFGKYKGGRPDVVFMVYDPDNKKMYSPGDGETITDYDDGEKYQKQSLENKGSAVSSYPIAPKSEWYGEANYESNGGKMQEMSPDDFLKQTRPLEIDEVSRENIDDLKEHIKSGKTLDPLVLYANGKEDGRHRANAAKELGITKVPVINFRGKEPDNGEEGDNTKALPDEVKHHEFFKKLLERGAFEPSINENNPKYPEVEFHPKDHPNLTPFHSGYESRPNKISYYDPRYAELKTINEDDPIIAKQIAVPKGNSQDEIEPLDDPDTIYRGISSEEYDSIMNAGEVRSKGTHNIGGEQEGLTYWSKTPSQASHYANGFAPAEFKPTPSHPAYIVATKMPKETRHVRGVGEDEVGVSRSIKRDELTGIWRGDPYIYEPARYGVPKRLEDGVSGIAASADLHWTKLGHTKDAFEESKHPRGQPGNKGQFGPGGGGSKTSTTSKSDKHNSAAARTDAGEAQAEEQLEFALALIKAAQKSPQEEKKVRDTRVFKLRDTKVFLHFHDDFDPQEERDPSGKWTKGGGGAGAKVKLERKPRRGSVSGSFEPLEKKEAGEKKAGEKKKPDVWTLPGGKPLPRHIQKLLGYKRIPPKWTDVRYNPDPKGELLIVGRDDENRQQPLYSEKHDKSAAADKFTRSQRLDGSKFDSVMAKNNKCKSSTNPKVRDMASILALIMHTGIRPDTEGDTKAEFKSYGATTLEGRHVTTNEKGEPILRFVSGKKHGKEIDIALDDAEIAKDLQQRAKQSGPNAQLFPTANARQLLNHVKSLAGASFKTKDFRTLLGTRVAATEVAKMPIPQSPSEYKKFCKEVGTKVSEVLGNTAAVALQSYIAPHVFAEWKLASGA